MTGYRNDETADLRREVEELTLKLDMADQEERYIKGQLKKAEDANAKSEREIRRLNDRAHDAGGHAISRAAAFALVTSGTVSATALVLFLLGAAFASCSDVDSSPANETGVITDRYHYHASHYTTCSGTRPIICTPHTIPEHWSVRVAHDGHERDVSLSENEWTEMRIGATWCESPPCAPLVATEER